MNRQLQSALLQLYAIAARTGFLTSRWGRAGFETAYLWHKRWLEAGEVRSLQAYVAPDTWVIDVGANIGFFTERFARWVSGPGRVLAFEPERRNCERLRARLTRQKLSGVVDVFEAAVLEREGPVALALNPTHPGDHRIADEGLTVAGLTLDGSIDRLGGPPVSLIKIDVQGAEHRVLEGARGVLARDHPALFVELDDNALRELGSNVRALLEWLGDHGYAPYRLTAHGPHGPLEVADVLAWQQEKGYVDGFFLPRSSSTSGAGNHGEVTR